jgi:hypothetical protein
MIDEYKTSDWFWAEAVNTTYHATNRLHLHKLLKKTPCELLTGNKSNVSLESLKTSAMFFKRVKVF